jgi:enamine deaminase RidA (YjgF/YER057c/UK114 family)
MAAAPHDRLEFSEDDLLESGGYEAPLFANQVRCHGGFDARGEYRSPRTVHRAPAIAAWQARLAAEGHPLLAVDPALMPPQYPSAEQAKLLLGEGVSEPIVRALTIISIVEGFGAIIRDVPVPDLRASFREPVAGTALAHLGRGLFEAHARDEAGHRDEGGHKQMWEAARDLALENPKVPGDVLMRIMGRRAQRQRRRLLPEIDADLERMLTTMATVLAVEIFAARTFDWGERLLSDPEVSARPAEAGAMVRYIRADESPHVEYLRTALSEVAARTLVTVDGRTLPGRVAVDRLMHANLHALTSERPRENRADVREGLSAAIARAGRGPDLLERLDALETPWTPPARTGFEPREGDSAASA